MGGGEIEEIAQSAEKLSSCLERSLTSVPIFWKPFVIFIATRNRPSMKITSGFRGIVFGLAKPEQCTG